MKRREMEALSVEECRRFLAVAKESNWFGLFALALTTGMRPSEYLALKWSDIDWQRGTASVCRTIQRSGSIWTFEDTKRKRSRRLVKLQGFVLEALESMQNSHLPTTESEPKAEHDLIFGSGPGDPLRQPTVKREFRKFLKAAGIRPIRLYDLRHTPQLWQSRRECLVRSYPTSSGMQAYRLRWSAIPMYFPVFKMKPPPE